MAFHRVASLDAVPDGEMLRVEAEGVGVALYNVEGEVFATQDRCSHGDWSLADGYLDEDIVECPLHGGKFCVRTGKVTAFPPTVPLRTYPVRLDGSDILVDVE